MSQGWRSLHQMTTVRKRKSDWPSSNLEFVQEVIILNDHVREVMIGLQNQLVTGPGRMAMSDIPLALAIISRETGQ